MSNTLNGRALYRLERFARIVGDTANIGAWYLELADGELVWSDEVCRIHDEPAGFQPTLAQALDNYTPASRAILEPLVEACINYGSPFDTELEILTARQRRVTVRVIGEAERDEAGNVTCIQGSTQDMTEYRALYQHIEDLSLRLRETLQNSNEGFLAVDHDWQISYINAAAERYIGEPADSMLGHNLWEVFPDLRGSEIETRYWQALTEQIPVRFETYYSPLTLWAEINAYPTRQGLAIYFRRINERKQAEQRLKLLEHSVEASLNGIVIVDARGPDMPIVYVNPAFERMTGYASDEVTGHNCRFLQGEKTDQAARAMIRRALSAGEETHAVLRNYRKDGTTFWNSLYISPVLDEAGTVTHFLGVQHDISAERHYESQLAYNTSHDVLTGMPNRFLFMDRLEQACNTVSRSERKLAVLFIDLDEFKPINDSLGHDVGDRVLEDVARRLTREVRAGDTVARLGGDEFIALLTDLTDVGGVPEVAERILASLARPYVIGGQSVRITASVGIATTGDTANEPAKLVQHADMAMFRAKRRGRNTWDWYTTELGEKISHRVEMRSDLQVAIEEEQFEVFYQPQVRSSSGQVVAVEALLRWQHPERGQVSPNDFIPLAEQTGQIVPIGNWVLNRACADAAHLNSIYLGTLVVSVNISPHQFQRTGFEDSVIAALEKAGLAPQCLELELTENVLMDNVEEVIVKLKSLRDRGIRIAIDDFGTGFSSMSYLRDLPLDKIKIDQAFIQNLVRDHRDAALVEGISLMARKLELDVVAEGVETEAQQGLLERHKVDICQGYLAARPMRLLDLIGYLEMQRNRQLSPGAAGTPVSGPTLLLIDDEENVLRALARALRREGYRILAVKDAQSAFELLAVEPVRVIISDQIMPGMTGTEFFREVKSMYPHTIRIVLSGYTDLRTVTDAINEGAIYKFLSKPWNDDELRHIIRNAFREALPDDAEENGL